MERRILLRHRAIGICPTRQKKKEERKFNTLMGKRDESAALATYQVSARYRRRR